ncbi:hypothetical protein COEREDRAFT_10691 [Coemansia reversa NRRL 1564]|uniref:Uncharacterized protein n=1 Tax=Coemansia reversa (strain ATCC 12441 / NRRL 1564) TaxID=763665 RepID=A0A2G5B584_COERN|nr:hypothetical protein COEREDRAFT_10691 [Coemansia reversa NRRL 1564]|eukprot:PIA14166.1 hypothetical protein COEREDRAFT_10691 [Coemansia reversa NRRL 1564]
MKLEQKLAKWVERPEDDDDDDYGLIIDASVTAEGPPRAMPFPPKFTKAGSCSQLPGNSAMYSPAALLPANIRPLGKPADAGYPQRPIPRPSFSTQDVLQRYAESDDSDNYDDLVLPEDEEMLDRQLTQWKTPCRRLPSWPNDLADEVTMSGATAVETAKGSAKAMSATRPSEYPKHTPTLGILAPRRHALVAAATAQPTPPDSTSAQRLARSSPHSIPRKLPVQAQTRQTRRPMLIKNVSHAAEPVVLGRMRYDPVRCVWIGNEDDGMRIANAIAESERQLRARNISRSEHRLIDASKLARKISQRSGHPSLSATDSMAIDSPEYGNSPEAGESRFVLQTSVAANHRRRLSPTNPLTQASIEATKGRPALIPPSAASLVNPAPGSAAGSRARPIFDPQSLRWIDPNENQLGSEDPFWDIADLPVEPSPIDAIHFGGRLRSASEAIGGDARDCFVLSDEQIEAYHRESIDYEAFAQHWFPRPST